MNKKLRIIPFTALLVTSVVLLSHFMFVPLDKNTTAYGSFYSEKEDSLDLVMVGSSTVRDGFIPMEAYHDYGITSHSIVSSPTHLEVIEIAIDEIARTQNPKVVYIDLNGLNNQTKDNADSFVKDYFSCMPDCQAKTDLTKKYDYLNESSEWEPFTNHNTFRQQIYWESFVYNKTIYTKGYNPNKKVEPQEEIDVDTTKTLPLSEDATIYLNEIIEKCKQYPEINFIFGMMPRYLSDTISSFDLYQIHSPLEAMYIVRSAKETIQENGFTYLDFWEEKDILKNKIHLDAKTDQKDAEHLNYRGAKKFTTYFMDYLMDNFFKEPVSHSEEVKKEFDHDYEEYLEIIEPVKKALGME